MNPDQLNEKEPMSETCKDVYILQASSGQRDRPGGQGGRVPDLVCDHPGGGGRGREEGGAAVHHAGPHTLH